MDTRNRREKKSDVEIGARTRTYEWDYNMKKEKRKSDGSKVE